jgi:hypothetical protein
VEEKRRGKKKGGKNGSPAKAREAPSQGSSASCASGSSIPCLGKLLAFGASWRSKSSSNRAKNHYK